MAKHDNIGKRLEKKYPNYQIKVDWFPPVIYTIVRNQNRDSQLLSIIEDLADLSTAEGCQKVEDKVSDFILAAEKIGLLK